MNTKRELQNDEERNPICICIDIYICILVIVNSDENGKNVNEQYRRTSKRIKCNIHLLSKVNSY